MEKLALIMSYEDMLINQDRKHIKIVKRNGNKAEGPNNAVTLLKYAFEEIYGWSPQMVYNFFTPEVAEWMELDICVKKIPFPPELDKNKDYFYVATYLYPDKIAYNKRKTVLAIYERERYKENPDFPKDFFKNKEGKENYNLILRYVLSEHFYSSSIKDIYEYFSDKKQALNFFRDNHLYLGKGFFYSSYIEAIHSVLPPNDKNTFYLNYYRLIEEMRESKVTVNVYDTPIIRKNSRLLKDKSKKKEDKKNVD